MQLTFTVGRDTTPTEYQRLIAALVVLGDVTVEPPARQGDLWPSPPPPPYEPMPGGDECFTPEELAAAMVPSGPGVLVPYPSGAAVDTTTLGFGDGKFKPFADRGDDAPMSAEEIVGYAPTDPDVDSAGVRYDAEIHAATRSDGTRPMNKDGTFRARRNVDPALVERKLAEQKRLRELVVVAPSGPAVVLHPDPAPITAPPPPPPPTSSAPPPPPPPPAEPTAVPTTPAELLKWATGQGKTAAQCSEACQSIGLVDADGKGQISLVLGRPDAVPALYRALGGEP